MYYCGGSRGGWGGRQGMRPPALSATFHFHAVFDKKTMPNNRLTPPSGVGAPWEILDPPPKIQLCIIIIVIQVGND